jgi:hypothetical protein
MHPAQPTRRSGRRRPLLARLRRQSDHASIADVTNEQHQNMAGLVQPADFNADVVVRFLRENGIEAHVDELTGGFRFAIDNPGREEHVRFACVCLRASISYAIEAAYWCAEAKR